eukprot:3139685-Prymnesium_polylepis.1
MHSPQPDYLQPYRCCDESTAPCNPHKPQGFRGPPTPTTLQGANLAQWSTALALQRSGSPRP